MKKINNTALGYHSLLKLLLVLLSFAPLITYTCASNSVLFFNRMSLQMILEGIILAMVKAVYSWLPLSVITTTTTTTTTSTTTTTTTTTAAASF